VRIFCVNPSWGRKTMLYMGLGTSSKQFSGMAQNLKRLLKGLRLRGQLVSRLYIDVHETTLKANATNNATDGQ
jgi:hypothetical protein